MNIRIDRADQVFSQFIRLRDKECVRCHSKVQFNEKGLPITHQNSHYWSRGKENTRFEPTNCDTLCFFCHKLWGGDYRDDYMEFKIKQLGKHAYDRLKIQAHTLTKKDRKMAYLIAKHLLDSIKSPTF